MKNVTCHYHQLIILFFIFCVGACTTTSLTEPTALPPAVAINPTPVELSTTAPNTPRQPTATPSPQPTLIPTSTKSNTATPHPQPTDTPTSQPENVVVRPQNLSIGDLYAPQLGNLAYDVQHYTLALVLDPGVITIDGRATIEAISRLPNLKQISLDFVGFAITEILVEGVPASYFRQDNKLIVNLPKPVAAERLFTLKIAYNGTPTQEASPYVPFAPHLGLHYMPNNSLFVVSEPDGAQNWFPANDHPRDKATFRFELTVPEGLTGVANGVLVDVEPGKSLPDGTNGDLFVWEHNDPMATYLATVAVGKYERIDDISPAGVPLRHYVFPEHQTQFEQAVAPVGEMLDWMSELFGPYPFEEFGYVTTAQEGYSLETQTMIVLSVRMMREPVIVHEMSHMWFGNWVAPASWADIWRNEGFATYVTDMWITRDNPEALDQVIENYTELVVTESHDFPLNEPPPEQMFGRDSYLKGAVTAHALRQEVGDDAFFEGLRTYFERYGGGTATHAEFQATMEEAAGKSLDAFFQQWFQ